MNMTYRNKQRKSLSALLFKGASQSKFRLLITSDEAKIADDWNAAFCKLDSSDKIEEAAYNAAKKQSMLVERGNRLLG